MSSVDLINKTTYCDLTRYSSTELTWTLENYSPAKNLQHEFHLTDSIIMFLELRINQNFYSGSEYYYGSSYFCINPFVKYQWSKHDAKKFIKLQVHTSRGGANVTRDFSIMNKDFVVINSQSNFMTQCNINKYIEKNILTINVRATIKEVFDNFPIGNELLNTKGKILKDFHSLISNQQISDFKFIVEDKEFYVHKVLLAARSPVFMKMFTSDFNESHSKEGRINDISKEAFQEFLRFLYTETIEDINLYVLDLLAIADLYEVEDLKAICMAQLLTELTEENAPHVFQYAHRYRCDNELKDAAFKLIKSSFQKNNIEIPNEFIFAPSALQFAIEAKNKIFETLKVEVALSEMKAK
ncbi:hypothetical protein PVAND_009078 [Polypedilum vanderplanki]|uniref:BTB domain-containing protein n=1 Tax=Polypedilum vanderplanki TaxID=319348 RepID=A0A9J6CCN5_POLVA|nr:hypothetical protein PVAND_009078 [Polypedilum vanderplanki]